MMIEKAIYPNPEEDLSHMMKVDDGECPPGTRFLSALTRLEVLQRGEYDSEPATKLLLQLHTGKWLFDQWKVKPALTLDQIKEGKPKESIQNLPFW